MIAVSYSQLDDFQWKSARNDVIFGGGTSLTMGPEMLELAFENLGPSSEMFGRLRKSRHCRKNSRLNLLRFLVLLGDDRELDEF